MNFLLPEKVLETQICSVCKQYLSQGPVKVYRDAGTRCGRCCSKTDAGSASLIKNVLQNVIFPCINRYEGCRQLLRLQDVPEHEKNCISTNGDQYQCPLCPGHQYVPNALYLINHYKIFHKKQYLTQPSFHIDVSSACADHCFLYCNNYENILLMIRVVSAGSRLCISALTAEPHVGKIKYKVKFFENGSLKYVSEESTCHPGLNGLNFEVTEVNPHTILQAASSSVISCVLELNTEDLNYLMSTNKMKNAIQPAAIVPCKKSKQSHEDHINTIENDSENVLPEDYGRVADIEPNFAKLMPSIFVEPLNRQFTNTQTITEVRGDVTMLVDLLGSVIDTLCGMCENYYATCGPDFAIFHCEHMEICGNCIKNNGAICKNCKYLFNLKPQFYRLSYYCRFGCNQICYQELSSHETLCELNPLSSLTDIGFAKHYFGEYFRDTSPSDKSTVVRSNRVVFRRETFGDNGQIYMIVDYSFQFKCIIMYKTDYKRHCTHFSVLHRYCREKCYFLFKIVKDNKYDEQDHSFYIDEIDHRASFVVVMRKKYQ